MDALILALLLTLVLDQGSGSQRLAARLADEGRAPVLPLALAVALNGAVAAAIGAATAALLVAEARLLFLSIALALSGLGLIASALRHRGKDIATPPGLWRAACQFALRRAGENAAFATAGVAALTDAPILAAVGAALGGWAALLVPLTLGQAALRHAAMRAFHAVAGLILLSAAIACAASALHLL